jgi:GH24 family phage-related lysozyme (muramidase)
MLASSGLNGGHYDAVPGRMRLYNKSAGRTLSALVKRREAEIKLWQGGT